MFWELPPEAIIIDGKITNSAELKRYWGMRHHKENMFHRALFDSNRQFNEQSPIIAVKPAAVPVPQYQTLDQIKGMVINLQNKLNEHISYKKGSLPKAQAECKGIEL